MIENIVPSGINNKIQLFNQSFEQILNRYEEKFSHFIVFLQKGILKFTYCRKTQ